MNIHEATLMNLDRWQAGKKNIGLSYRNTITYIPNNQEKTPKASVAHKFAQLLHYIINTFPYSLDESYCPDSSLLTY